MSVNKFDSESQVVSITPTVGLAGAWSIALQIAPSGVVRRSSQGVFVIDGFYKHPHMPRSMALLLIRWWPSHLALYHTLCGTPLQSCLHDQRRSFSRVVGEALDVDDWIEGADGWLDPARLRRRKSDSPPRRAHAL